MTEQNLERPGDVGQAYARLWEATSPATDEPVPTHVHPGEVVVLAADLRLVLEVPAAHATTDEAVRRALATWDGRGRLTEARMRAAIVAALGVPEPVEAEPVAVEQEGLPL